MKEVSVNDARKLGKELGVKGIVILTFSDSSFSAASYGITRNECGQMGNLLESISRKIEKGELKVWDDSKIDDTVMKMAGTRWE